VFSGELDDRREVSLKTIRMLGRGQFAELDQLAAYYRENEIRTSSGLWKLTFLYDGLDEFLNINDKNEAFWIQFRDITDNYLEQRPESPTAIVMKGIYLKQYAWKFRGGGWAREVPATAWKPFRENLRIADAFLQEAESLGSTDPHWHSLRVEILKGLGADKRELEPVLLEGLSAFPYYYDLYFEAIDYFSPRWQGDAEKIEVFANYAVSLTQENEGMGLYARVYWSVGRSQYRDNSLFIRSRVDWEKMKEGILDVTAVYPDDWNIQNFAYFACLKGDSETTRALLEQMRTSPISGVWNASLSYEVCRERAGL
jgi:hypothetical protein